MPYGRILSSQAMGTLRQLHGELAGKITDNKRADGLRLSMQQVDAVIARLSSQQ